MFASTMPAANQSTDLAQNQQNFAPDRVMLRTLPAEKQAKGSLPANTMQSQTDSMYSDSVKYYVLEGGTEPTYGNLDTWNLIYAKKNTRNIL